MRVLFLQQQPCIRALKYAEGIKQVRPDITLYFAYRGKTLTELYGHGDELFEAWFPLHSQPKSQLRDIVSRHQIDVVHSHNAPDTLTNLFIDLFRGRTPIIHDIHDLMSIRRTAYEDGFQHETAPACKFELERRAVERSDAVIAVSAAILDIVRRRYRVPTMHCVFSNYVPRRFVPLHLPEPKVSSGELIQMVYEGFLSNNGGHYDLAEIFRAIASEGVHVHLYPSRENPRYRALGDSNPYIHYHDHLPPQRLFKELTHYDLGWAGFNDGINSAHTDTVMPNKAFEYIACGLPVLTFPHKSLKRFLETHGVGVVIEQVKGLRARLRSIDLVALKRNARAKRHAFTVEANVSRVIEMYEALAAKDRPILNFDE